MGHPQVDVGTHRNKVADERGSKLETAERKLLKNISSAGEALKLAKAKLQGQETFLLVQERFTLALLYMGKEPDPKGVEANGCAIDLKDAMEKRKVGVATSFTATPIPRPIARYIWRGGGGRTL